MALALTTASDDIWSLVLVTHTVRGWFSAAVNQRMTRWEIWFGGVGSAARSLSFVMGAIPWSSVHVGPVPFQCSLIPVLRSGPRPALCWQLGSHSLTQGPSLPAQHVIEVCKQVVLEQMSTFANSVKRTCAAVCPLYGDVPMGAPGPPGQKGPPGAPVGFFSGMWCCWLVQKSSTTCFEACCGQSTVFR